MSMKTHKSVQIKEGSTVFEMIVDQVNDRVGFWVGGTEVVRMSSTAFSPVLDIGLIGGDLDLGSSGAAGSLDVFPSGTTKGKLSITAADSAGDTTTGIVNASQAGARTYTIPDAGASASFVMTEGAQTLNGAKTFGAPIVVNIGTAITAFATGGQASATALTAEYNNVATVASNFDSVKLLTAVAGQRQIVKNNGAAILSVFPNTSDSINALAVNLSIDIPVGGEVEFTAVDATVWHTRGTISLSAPSTQKGTLAIRAADSSTNTQTLIINASQAAARTYTIPDAGASASFVMTEGNQTVNGIKTFGSMFRIPYNGSVAAAGTTAADAAALSEGLSVVTGANGTVGVKLPTPVAGSIVIIKGTTNGVLKVWPGGTSSGVGINGVGADTAMSLASGLIPAIFIAISATQYYTFPLLPS